MIWLGALGGAGPISATGSPIATPTIGGTSFSLYYGLNGSTKVYSFVASSKSVTNYSGDLKAFFTYLSSSQGVPTNYYLISIGAGTEPFTGSNAKLTNTYSLSVNTGGSSSPGGSTTTPPVSTTTTSKPSSITSPPAAGATQSKYGQCGGSGYSGPTVCAAGSTCSAGNPWYSQCV
jgi:xyloglucan-specific endo-beta-1,4-glucanase